MKYKLTDKSVFLTGGSGFLGSHLRKALRDKEASVKILNKKDEDVHLRNNESVIKGDVRDEFSLSESPDVAIHFAARTSIDASIEDPRETWDVNATGTLNFLEACRKHRPDRVLVASTASIYGIPQYLPVDEAHPIEPREPYGASKVAADRLTAAYARTYNVPAMVVRPFNVYGPGQPTYNVVGEIIEQATTGNEVELGNLQPKRDFSHVKDVISGILYVLQEGEIEEAYNIGYGKSVSIETLAETITGFFGENINIESNENKKRSNGVEIPEIEADTSKLESLGWEPKYNLQAGLRNTISEW